MQTRVTKVMYPKNIYYPHKNMYLLVFLFRDTNFLVLHYFFVYILPCFHPYIIGAWSSLKRRRGDGVSQSRFGRWETRWASKVGGEGGKGSGDVGVKLWWGIMQKRQWFG
jgi:hypothetical protein